MSCNDPDHMKCPCLCDCGQWFEVTDGWLPPGETSGPTVCIGGRMSEVEKTIADIRAMPNNTEAWWVSSLGDNDRFEASKLHALADAYELQLAINTELNAENAELREALGHYANKSHWDESGVFGTKHDLYLGSQHYHGTDHGYEHAQAVLDKYKSKKS